MGVERETVDEGKFGRLCVVLPFSEIGNPPNDITLMAVRFFQHQSEADIFIVPFKLLAFVLHSSHSSLHVTHLFALPLAVCCVSPCLEHAVADSDLQVD